MKTLISGLMKSVHKRNIKEEKIVNDFYMISISLSMIGFCLFMYLMNK